MTRLPISRSQPADGQHRTASFQDDRLHELACDKRRRLVGVVVTHDEQFVQPRLALDGYQRRAFSNAPLHWNQPVLTPSPDLPDCCGAPNPLSVNVHARPKTERMWFILARRSNVDRAVSTSVCLAALEAGSS